MQLNLRDIVELQSQRDNPMVSIFVPLTPDRPRQAEITLRNLIRETQRRLDLEFAPKETRSLLVALKDRAGSVDLTRGHGSVALFASADDARVIGLPYEVGAEVVVDETYATRNLVHALQRAPRYLIVVVDDGELRCFEAVGSSFVELDGCSLRVPDDPSPGVAWQGRFARSVDELIDGRLAEDPIPIILLAPPALEAAFLKRSMVRGHVVASSSVRLGTSATDRVREVARRLIERRQVEDQRAVLARLIEARDRNRLASGIHEVWEATHLGSVALLVVEQGFRFPAKYGPDDVLVATGDASLPGVIDDAVDEVIETALRHDAELRFVSDADLDDCGRIAAVTRWTVSGVAAPAASAG